MLRHLSKRLTALTLVTGMLTVPMMGVGQAQTAEAPTSLTETYKSWIVRCVTPTAIEGQAAPARICEMVQELNQQKSGQRLLAMALQPTKAEGVTLTFIAPFGLLLSAGLKVAVDGTAVAQGGFRTCLPRGCVSVINLENGTLDKFIAGDTATITMRDTNGREISVTVSLSGFTAAWNRLKKFEPAR